MSLFSFNGSYWATLLFCLVLMLLPIWIGYRRKISRTAMLMIMLIGGLIPYVGFLASLYIAFRAKSQNSELSPSLKK